MHFKYKLLLIACPTLHALFLIKHDSALLWRHQHCAPLAIGFHSTCVATKPHRQMAICQSLCFVALISQQSGGGKIVECFEWEIFGRAVRRTSVFRAQVEGGKRGVEDMCLEAAEQAWLRLKGSNLNPAPCSTLPCSAIFDKILSELNPPRRAHSHC